MRFFEGLPKLKQLRAFDAVASTGSIMAASRKLRVTQPAITYSLGRLEFHLERRLFQRRATGSFLTSEGALLQGRTARFFRQIQDAVSATAGTSPDLTETIAKRISESEIEALLAIWQAGTFRTAALRLGIAEPSLQRPARDIERLMRVSLFRRASVGWEVNAAGAELARRLSLALEEVWAGIEEVGSIAALGRTNLRVGVLALSPRVILAEAVGQSLSGHVPQKIEVIEGPYESLSTALRSGSLDMIFGALRNPPPHGDLNEEPLLEDPYVLVCRPSHPLLRKRHIEPAQMAQYDFIFPAEGLPRRAVLDRLLRDWRIEPRTRIDTSCFATILALVRTSDRITLLSRWHVGLDGWADLRCLDGVHVPHEQRFVGVTTRANWLPTPFQRSFLAFLRESVETWAHRHPIKVQS